MITSTVAMRLAWRAARSRGTVAVACLKRNSSAFAAAEPSTIPETEFEAREKFREHFNRDSSLPEEDVYSLSFPNDSLESDFESDNACPLLDERMKRQLRDSHNAFLSPSDSEAQNLRSRMPPQLNLCHLEASTLGESIKPKHPRLEQGGEENSASLYAQPLPKAAYDIITSKLDEDARAIIVTETKNPFRIVAVNTAWENLCGYSREECKGRSIGRLLQGPGTDMDHVATMVGKLLQGEEAGAMLTNYTKQGRKFQNKIRVGPIFDEMGKTVNFVGVLHEVEDFEGNLTNRGDRGRMQLPFMS